MNSIPKNIIFCITILECNEEEQSFLRKMIHSVLPQAIVESIYNNQEANRYFNNCSTMPQLFFVAQDMLNVSGEDTIKNIKRLDQSSETQIICLKNSTSKSQRTDIIKLSETVFYVKPFTTQDLLDIVSSLNMKRVA
ncbi:hypothetical protein [Aurantibacillus circumpalustris]|uniref:hypothetical protein n=1 Tax=Aurantibacillus circumpalustris TaxID=3036359 RepID=UPI00295C0C3D|nr:hypothetical protein [Aurantibacillus circumpalustris]